MHCSVQNAFSLQGDHQIRGVDLTPGPVGSLDRKSEVDRRVPDPNVDLGPKWTVFTTNEAMMG
jgi:hypothetical protein